jgi:hypothetical protein
MLWAQPDAIGRSIVEASIGGSAPIRYAPSFWRWIMTIIRNVPAPIFHRTKL